MVGTDQWMIKLFAFYHTCFCITRSERLFGSEVKEYNSFSPNVFFAYSRQAEAASVAYP